MAGWSIKTGIFFYITDDDKTGIGEAGFIEGLSIDNLGNYEDLLRKLCAFIERKDNQELPDLIDFPSISFAYECAVKDLQNGGEKMLFPSEFTTGKDCIPINGLVWMGNKEFMLDQISEKLQVGFSCIKIKVGAIDFAEEVELLKFIRLNYPADVVEIRLDANGAFAPDEVYRKLHILSQFNIHSIEQPIKAGQIKLMAEICSNSPIPVALDEELIGRIGTDKSALLEAIKPAYIILKPSLLGGFKQCSAWIEAATKLGIAWWVTSALESNIGLNAIAQWTFTQKNPLVQGLGTGGLYINNISSPLSIKDGNLFFDPKVSWGNIGG